ncbi:hypothetical protein [Nocardia cyriacigeorgica]|uniref:hypothetical protein n=1 Tax=Nocardia cyriacigeorgica TaxID=135487 RepID=UPI0014874731|nr:hypothetical protein [Nocardia cyriacigeorgica]MBF6515304.1 hypothetical protein [Nocardia cyriacigeorgica]
MKPATACAGALAVIVADWSLYADGVIDVNVFLAVLIIALAVLAVYAIPALRDWG